MSKKLLHTIVRTPHGVVFEQDLEALRVPVETGQVGLRPGGEPAVLAIAAGLVIARGGAGDAGDASRRHFIGTAGGLLTLDGAAAVLLTPLAVTGTTAEGVLAELENALATPNAEMEARAAIERLERGILQELRRERGGGRPGPVREIG
jgi:F0F1-type ATP synthase epsilon subunit